MPAVVQNIAPNISIITLAYPIETMLKFKIELYNIFFFYLPDEAYIAVGTIAADARRVRDRLR